jgi:hypothetical protein
LGHAWDDEPNNNIPFQKDDHGFDRRPRLPDIPQNVRLENLLCDDHLGVSSLTIEFELPNPAKARS